MSLALLQNLEAPALEIDPDSLLGPGVDGFHSSSYKAKHCLLGRKYVNDTAVPFNFFIKTFTEIVCRYPQGMFR